MSGTQQRIAPLISKTSGISPVPLMTPLAWTRYRALRRTQISQLGTPPCDQTLNIELIYAKQLLSWSVERGLIKRNPLTAARRVKTISQRETRLTAGRCRPTDRLRPTTWSTGGSRTATTTGSARPSSRPSSSALFLTSSLRLATKLSHLRFDRIREGGAVELAGSSETKSKRRRSIRLTPRTLEAISVIHRVPGSDYVFAGEAGGLIGETTIRAWWRRACEISGVDERATLRDKQVRPHDARAGGATCADEAGAFEPDRDSNDSPRSRLNHKR